MLNQDDLWWMEEPLLDDPSDLLRMMPEIRNRLAPERRDDELGLRSLLEHPEALATRRWAAPPSPRPRGPRRQAAVLRAA